VFLILLLHSSATAKTALCTLVCSSFSRKSPIKSQVRALLLLVYSFFPRFSLKFELLEQKKIPTENEVVSILIRRFVVRVFLRFFVQRF